MSASPNNKPEQCLLCDDASVLYANGICRLCDDGAGLGLEPAACNPQWDRQEGNFGDEVFRCHCGAYKGAPCRKLLAALPAAPAPTEQAELRSAIMDVLVSRANGIGEDYLFFKRAPTDDKRPLNMIVDEIVAALAARQAPTGPINGDAIAKSKNILNLVDDYHDAPSADTRTTLRKALMDEFEVAVARPSPDGVDARDAKRWRFMMKVADDDKGPEAQAMNSLGNGLMETDRPESDQMNELLDQAIAKVARETPHAK